MANLTAEQKYGISFDTEVQKFLPVFYYENEDGSLKMQHLQWLYSGLSALGTTNENFVTFVDAIRTRLRYSGQILSLEELLNDCFDLDLRRIFITKHENEKWAGGGIRLFGEEDVSVVYGNDLNLRLDESEVLSGSEEDNVISVALDASENSPTFLYLGLFGEDHGNSNLSGGEFIPSFSVALDINEINETPYSVALFSESEDPSSLWRKDFTVNVPVSLGLTEQEIRAKVELYSFSDFLIETF